MTYRLQHVHDSLTHAFTEAGRSEQVLYEKGAPVGNTAAGHAVFALRHLVTAMTNLAEKVEFLLSRAAEEDTRVGSLASKRLIDPAQVSAADTKIDVILHPAPDILVNLPPTVGVRLTWRGKQYGKWTPVNAHDYNSPGELLYIVESLCRDLRTEGLSPNSLTEGVNPEPGRYPNWERHMSFRSDEEQPSTLPRKTREG